MKQVLGWLYAGGHVVFVTSVLVWHAHGYRLEWNSTASLGLGLYHCHIRETDDPLPLDTFVVFTLTQVQQRFMPQAGPGPMLKKIGARAPQRVCFVDGGVWLDETRVAARPVPVRLELLGCRTLGANEYMAFGTHARSYDSRYYGPITLSQVTETCTPLLTWEARP